jgi:ATP-dependent RNA helicase SUPV3L1/SUV3
MLYENNGVLKREFLEKLLKNIDQKERKILRDQGVKFGRYHIFLYKLFKPNIVSLRLILWKNYNEKNYNLEPPTFGLNFINDKKFADKNFMLLCGFENDKYYFKYNPIKKINKKTKGKSQNDNPFAALKQLNIK